MGDMYLLFNGTHAKCGRGTFIFGSLSLFLWPSPSSPGLLTLDVINPTVGYHAAAACVRRIRSLMIPWNSLVWIVIVIRVRCVLFAKEPTLPMSHTDTGASTTVCCRSSRSFRQMMTAKWQNVFRKQHRVARTHTGREPSSTRHTQKDNTHVHSARICLYSI